VDPRTVLAPVALAQFMVVLDAVRDPVADHLMTPQNSALLVIDYQPTQLESMGSMDHDLLVKNAISTVKLAKLYSVPVVHSTIQVASGREAPTLPELAELLEDDPPVDRTTMNSWEDPDLLHAVRATGRRKLIICALATEICLAFAALDALLTAYDVYPSSMRSAGPRSKPTAPAWSVWRGLAASPSAGSRPPASFSATGPARRRFRIWCRSCSPNAYSRHDPRWRQCRKTRGKSVARPAPTPRRGSFFGTPTRSWRG
jgi:hypothetical protein